MKPFAFHATLWRSMQLLDELPMVWANSVFIFIVVAMEDTRERHPRRVEAFAITVVTLLVSVAVVIFDKEDQNIFLLGYGGGVVFLFIRSGALNFKHNSRGKVLLLETAMFFYGGGFLLWLVDRMFCPTVRSLYLHAFWHLTAGIGTFTIVLFWIWIRQEVLGTRPQLRGSSPATRWVDVGEKHV